VKSLSGLRRARGSAAADKPFSDTVLANWEPSGVRRGRCSRYWMVCVADADRSGNVGHTVFGALACVWRLWQSPGELRVRVVSVQVAPSAIEHVNRGQRERPGAAHAATQRQCLFRKGVIGAEPPDAHELVVGYRVSTLGKVIFTVTAQHPGEGVALDSESSRVLNLP
jgi:hypothetical protein